MRTPSRNDAIIWGFIAVAVLVNIAGYVWDLYERFIWFDEALHVFTTFALTLLIARLLYGVILKGAQTHPVLFVLTVVSLGLAIGSLWEIGEWAYDQIVPSNVILGKTDTIIDLLMDIVGAIIAGVVSMGMAGTNE